jgi:N-acetyl sugar amidotransferase
MKLKKSYYKNLINNLQKINYQQCVYCVMDTSDSSIIFDSKGQCNHCINFFKKIKNKWFPNKHGADQLSLIINRIKTSQKKKYDCILGLSGGIDSSYLAIKMHELGLRPLVVHVDAGWNSELASSNIESIVKYCNFDLHTHVVDWDEMRDLQLAYFRSGIANQDVPQDHIFLASVYHFAILNKIPYILSGSNLATEGILPRSWQGTSRDSINLKSIHQHFGTISLKQYKTISFFEYYFWYPVIKKMKIISPLNYMPYNKEEALLELKEKTGYRKYQRKHGESQFTKFYQNYYLPQKFGYDKRLAHFSSLIVSGQMTRIEALKKLNEPLYEKLELDNDILYLCKKLRISKSEFHEIMNQPNQHHTNFDNWGFRYKVLKQVQKLIFKIFNKKLGFYS